MNTQEKMQLNNLVRCYYKFWVDEEHSYVNTRVILEKFKLGILKSNGKKYGNTLKIWNFVLHMIKIVTKVLKLCKYQ